MTSTVLPLSVSPETTAISTKRWILAFVLTPLLAGALIVGYAKTKWSDFSVPMEYGHDALPVLVTAKTILEKGWWYENDRLGAPRQLEWYDYPSSPNLQALVMRGVAMFVHDPMRLVNYYFLLSFPLVALTALGAFGTLGLRPLAASLASLLYAFAPYHFIRGISHLWLGCYYMVPLGIMVLAWIWQSRADLVANTDDRGKIRWKPVSGISIAAFAICFALGFDFPYYPIFLCFFLVLIGCQVSFRDGNWVSLVRAGVLVVVTAAGFLVNIAPNLAYSWKHGPNPSPHLASIRSWSDAEAFGFKIAPSILPAITHPIESARAVTNEYLTGTVALGEDAMMSLGMIGTLGFLLLLGWLLCRRPDWQHSKLFDALSTLTIMGILLATVGGFGAVLNLLTSGMMRCYNRISIFLAFFAIAMAFIVLEDLARRFGTNFLRRSLAYGAVTVFAILGLVEQTHIFRFAHADEFYSDRSFVQSIQASVPAEAAIFQYPVQKFLSVVGPNIARDPYTHFRGYMHSSSLRWSFGAVCGREGATIQESIGTLPTREAADRLALMGFAGIYIDREMYADQAQAFEAELRDYLTVEPQVSPNQRLSFFPLAKHCELLVAGLSRAQVDEIRETLVNPVVVQFVERPVSFGGKKGFFVEEVYPTDRFRWCESDGELIISNFGSRPRTMQIQFEINSSDPNPGRLEITGPLLRETHEITQARKAIDRTITVPPGNHAITFHCDANPLLTPVRAVVFQLAHFRCDPCDVRLPRGPALQADQRGGIGAATSSH